MLKNTLNRIEQALSSPKRNIMLSIVLVSVGAFAIIIGNARSNRQRIEQAYGEGISAAVAVCSQAIAKVFGEDGLGGVEQAWLGLRVYEPELDAWVEIEEVDQTLEERVVVLVHGLDEPGGIWDELAPALASDGHTVVRFEYANDQAIALSGERFLESLEQLTERSVSRMDVVCHSMGGLVARDAITREEFGEQGITIERLVTIGTPHGGSPWARLRAVSELREQVQRWVESDDLDPKRLMGFARDGVGQAGTDLLPGSDFFVELDGRAMPDGVRVTCIVGRMVAQQGSDLGSILAAGALSDLVGDRDAGVIVGEFEKLSKELGDGVVPVSSAVLGGVDDVVILQANHRSMIRSIELGKAMGQIGQMMNPGEPPAIAVVLDRLKRE